MMSPEYNFAMRVHAVPQSKAVMKTQKLIRRYLHSLAADGLFLTCRLFCCIIRPTTEYIHCEASINLNPMNMKLGNSSFPRWKIETVAHLIIILICVGSFSFFFEGSQTGADVRLNHIPAICAGYVSDWHSALFLREMMALRSLGEFLGFPLTPVQTLDFGAYIALSLSVFSLCCWLHVMMKKDVRFVVLSPLLSGAFAGSVIFLNQKFLGAIDYYFFSFLLMSITCLIFLRSKKKVLRVLFCVILFVSLIHVISFRRNALLMLPFLLYGTWVLLFPQMRWIRRVILTLISSVLVAFLSSGLSLLLTQERGRTHSVFVMLVSDLRVASLLRGEEYQEAAWLENHTPLMWPLRTQFLLRADAGDACRHSELVDPMGRTLLGEKGWEELSHRYFESWLLHPESMLVARVIQASQFYFGSETLQIVRKWIDSSFPAVHRHPERWILPQPEIESHRAGKLSLAWVAGVLVAILYGWHGVKRQRVGENQWRFCFFLVLLAFVYEFSFLIVTPAPFSRYRMPSLLLVLFFIPWACLDMLFWRLRRGGK